MDKLFALPLWALAWFLCTNALYAGAIGNLFLLIFLASLTLAASIIAAYVEWGQSR